MQRRLVGHGELAHIPCLVGELGIELELVPSHGLAEQLVQVFQEILSPTHQVNQVCYIMLYIPPVGPAVILSEIIPGTHASCKFVVEGFNEFPFRIFWVKEAGFGMEDIPVVERFFIKEVS